MTRLRHHLYLSGPMGAGKSTVGRVLAADLGLPFVDLDARVEAEAEQAIEAIFATEGEGGFRRREARALAAAAASHAPAVIALGGGTVLSAENRRLLGATGVVVHLAATPETLAGRLGDGANRPLLRDGPIAERLATLLAARRSAYGSADLRIDTDGLAPEAVAGIIRHRIAPVPQGGWGTAAAESGPAPAAL